MCKSTKCQSKCKVPCAPNVQVIDPDVATFYKLMENPENPGFYIEDPSQPVSVFMSKPDMSDPNVNFATGRRHDDPAEIEWAKKWAPNPEVFGTEIFNEERSTLGKFYTVSPEKREPIPEMTEETKALLDQDLKETRGYDEPTKPNYYKFNIKGIQCNMFDIARALGLSLELFSALKYFRVKGDTAKRINDLHKAKQCIDMEIENLSKSLKPNNHA